MTPYQHGYADGFMSMPCDKSQWWDNEYDTQQYLIGKHAGEFDAWMLVKQYNERFSYA